MGERARGPIQRHIHRVGVTAKIVPSFEQADVRLAAQRVGSTKARNTRTNNGDLHSEMPPGGGSEAISGADRNRQITT